MTGKPADTEQEAKRLMTVLQKEVESHGLVLEDITIRPAGKQQLMQITVDLPEAPTRSTSISWAKSPTPSPRHWTPIPCTPMPLPMSLRSAPRVCPVR
ncbi:hypothetical protein [Arthrobacter sp. JCM 19049]|uniref:hypothetical protein n=1 Tax=Arthrobacter sp. JCM 19049 TaxID=1460643 RepID=UPI0024367AD2|nr:hypothetical protein [Arthrobacter sp. JCM 19049]